MKEKTLTVNNFSVSYPISYYKNFTFRDFFVDMLNSPIDFLLKERDKIVVLDKISFDLFRGDKVGLIGNNGSGKSSLCRYISGLFGSTYGITTHGKVRGIFDTEMTIFPDLTGRENLVILCQLIYPNLSRNQREKIIKETEEFCDLGKFLHVPFKNYSKGMRARLFLSLISAQSSDILILDEVFNGADAFFSEKMGRRIRESIDNSGSVIFVSHDFGLVKELCNRVIIIDNQKIIYNGDVDEGIVYYLENCSKTLIQNG